jgi:O-antigen biosynthesis protein
MGYHYDHDIDLANDQDLYTRIAKLVGRNKNVLDVGCGSGQMGKVLVEHFGCRVSGLEIEEEACALAQARLWKVVQGDAEQIDLVAYFGAGTLDVILCLDVLEHMVNPWRFVSRLKPLLSSGGCIVATIPNVTHASVLLELLAGKFIYRELGLLDRNHLRFFTLETITEMFESAGYRLEHLDRNIVDVKYLELEADLDRFPPAIVEFVKSLPEATTYQYIIKAATRG